MLDSFCHSSVSGKRKFLSVNDWWRLLCFVLLSHVLLISLQIADLEKAEILEFERYLAEKEITPETSHLLKSVESLNPK